MLSGFARPQNVTGELDYLVLGNPNGVMVAVKFYMHIHQTSPVPDARTVVQFGDKEHVLSGQLIR